MSDSIDPLYYERAVADILGLSRDEFRHVRGQVLKKKTDWRLEGRDVVLTQAGLDKALTHLKATLNSAEGDVDFAPALLDQGSKSAASEKNGAAYATEEEPYPGGDVEEHGRPPAPVQLVTLTVTRVYPNYRLVQAATPTGETVDVRVRNNRNFVPRMTLQARPAGAGKYEMEGRCPRFRGRY